MTRTGERGGGGIGRGSVVRRVVLGVVAGVVLLLACGLGLAISLPTTATFTGAVPVAIDLGRPDGFIDTASLSALPRDLLTVPLFKDVLTEDLVAYYEDHPGLLTLRGVLRRLAYEHGENVGDWIIRTALDEPAQVALWQGTDGKIKHYLIVLRRGPLAQVMELAARLALRDEHLKQLSGGLTIAGKTVPAYALQTPQRTLLFAAQDDRLVIASDAGMIVDAAGTMVSHAQPVLDSLLGGSRSPYYLERLSLGAGAAEREARHRVVLTARYVSFGYQRFFPAVEAVRFDFDRDRWATRLMLVDAERARTQHRGGPPGDPPTPPGDPRALWQLMPVHPSACFVVPVDWKAAVPIARDLGAAEEIAQRVASAFDGPAAVCWYPRARLYAPVFVATLARALDAAETALVEQVFAAAIGRGVGDAPLAATQEPGGSMVWQRRVAYRPHPRAREEALTATLARSPRALVFSPDARLVHDVLAVADKRFPAIADVLPATGATLAVVAAPSLATLFEAEIAAVPGAHEPAFRTVASTHLAPRIAALKRYPTYALVMPPAAAGSPAPAGAAALSPRWTTVDWVVLARP